MSNIKSHYKRTQSTGANYISPKYPHAFEEKANVAAINATTMASISDLHSKLSNVSADKEKMQQVIDQMSKEKSDMNNKMQALHSKIESLTQVAASASSAIDEVKRLSAQSSKFVGSEDLASKIPIQPAYQEKNGVPITPNIGMAVEGALVLPTPDHFQDAKSKLQVAYDPVTARLGVVMPK